MIWVGGVEGCGDRDGELEVKSKKIGRITDITDSAKQKRRKEMGEGGFAESFQ